MINVPKIYKRNTKKDKPTTTVKKLRLCKRCKATQISPAAGYPAELASIIMKKMKVVKGLGRFVLIKLCAKTISLSAKTTFTTCLSTSGTPELLRGTNTSGQIMKKRVGKKENPNCVTIENGIPAIIDYETWRKAAKRMEEKKRGTNNAKQEYLLSGLLVCGHCGGAYCGFTSTNRASGEKTQYYTCSTKSRTKTCCAKNIRADELENTVYWIILDDLLIEKAADIMMEV